MRVRRDASGSDDAALQEASRPASAGSARYAVIGDPVDHSLSPQMQNAAFAACGIAATYERRQVRKEQLDEVFSDLRSGALTGCNVTTPLKDASAQLVDSLTPAAREAQAVNTVRREPDGRLSGHNTDGAGFLRAAEEVFGWRPAAGRALVAGSGPTARAIASALTTAGVQALYCWARDPERARKIGRQPCGAIDLAILTVPPEAEIPPPVQAAIRHAKFVFDCNYGARRSPLAPQSPAGTRESDGLPLLLHQGALAFTWWTGQTAPLAAMRAAIGLAEPGA